MAFTDRDLKKEEQDIEKELQKLKALIKFKNKIKTALNNMEKLIWLKVKV